MGMNKENQTLNMKLRSHLILLVVAALLPVLIFAGVMIVLLGKEQEKAQKDNLLDVARALSLAIDRELLASIRTLEALATSQHLDSGELRKFYQQAKRVLEAHQGWDNMLLVDLSGQQLVIPKVIHPVRGTPASRLPRRPESRGGAARSS